MNFILHFATILTMSYISRYSLLSTFFLLDEKDFHTFRILPVVFTNLKILLR